MADCSSYERKTQCLNGIVKIVLDGYWKNFTNGNKQYVFTWCIKASELRRYWNKQHISLSHPKRVNSYRNCYSRSSRFSDNQSQTNHCPKRVNQLLYYMWMQLCKPLKKNKISKLCAWKCSYWWSQNRSRALIFSQLMIAAFLFPLLYPCKNKPQLLLMFGSATRDKHCKSVIFFSIIMLCDSGIMKKRDYFKNTYRSTKVLKVFWLVKLSCSTLFAHFSKPPVEEVKSWPRGG